MINNGRTGGESYLALPALSGVLGPEFERRVTGGGSDPKEFVSGPAVKEIFQKGIQQLEQRLEETADKYDIHATMGRIRLRSNAIAKSHRHAVLFDKVQVAGVQEAGDILTLVTRNSLEKLVDLVERASEPNLVRLSAVSELTPYEAPIDRRGGRFVVSLFDGFLDDDSKLRDKGLQILEHLGVHLEPYGKSFHTFVGSAIPTDSAVKSMPWIRRIRPVFKVTGATLPTTFPSPRTHLPTPDGPLPSPIIGLIDSGIDASIQSLNRLVARRESHVPSQFADTSHGTLVGALAATGDGFNQGPDDIRTPRARLLDIQVIGTEEFEGIDEDDLLIQVEDAVQRFGPRASSLPHGVDQPVSIWNLSLNLKTVASDDEFSSFGMELDRIMRENGVVFTVPTGNYESQPYRGWESGHGPDVVANGNDRISPPADAALAITVGGLSNSSESPSIVPADHPSPFSRRGPGPGMLTKPDFVHYAGTYGRLGERKTGVRGPQTNGSPVQQIGTSFAAPRIAAQLAQLVELLPEPEPELLKLILLLSRTSPGDHNIQNRESINYYGFGVPDSPVSILSCNPWESTILLKGILRPGHDLRMPFPYPPSLEDASRQQRRGWIRMALVYFPVLDPSKGSEYCQTNVNASLGRDFGGAKPYKREVHPMPSENGAGPQIERELIAQTAKWSPVKLYERTFSRMRIDPQEQGWQLTLRLLLRQELEHYRDDIRQPFWLGIRIADPEGRSPIYREMSLQIGSLLQLVPLGTQIPVVGAS